LEVRDCKKSQIKKSKNSLEKFCLFESRRNKRSKKDNLVKKSAEK